MIPKPAEVWRHFKGNRYAVVGISRDSEAWEDESKQVVVYFNVADAANDRPLLIHRPLSMWTEHVDRDGYAGPRYVKEKDAPEHLAKHLGCPKDPKP